MTPKEKAKEIFDKMTKQTYQYQEYAGAHYTVEEIGWEAGKKCALIAVDELIEDNKTNEELVNGGLNKQYWQEVKKEIEKL